MSTTSRFWSIWAAPGLRRYLPSWVGATRSTAGQGVQVLGPVSEPSEDCSTSFVGWPTTGRCANAPAWSPRCWREARSRFELMAANLCEGATAARPPPAHARRGGPRARAADGALGRQGRAGGGRPARRSRGRCGSSASPMTWSPSPTARDREAAVAALERRRGRGYDPADRRRRPRRARRAPARGGRSRRVGARHRRRAAAGRDDLDRRAGVGRPGVRRVRRSQARLPVRALELGWPSSPRRPPRRSAARAPRRRRSAPPASSTTSAGWPCRTGSGTSPAPLSAGERERVRLHPYYTERVLERSGALAPLALLAGSHHERLDGSGYHRGAAAAQLSVEARLLGRRRRLRRDDPRSPAPARARVPAAARTELGEMVRAGGAREAGGGCRPRGGGRRTARGASGLPGRAQRPRGRGPAPRRAGSNEQGDRRRRS